MRRIVPTVVALAIASPVAAQQYRHPSDCGDGCMTVSAYFDHGGVTDWNCGGHTYGGHPGTDFAIYGGWAAVDEGRTVLAAAPGTVIEAHDGEFDRCTTGDCAGGGGYGNHVAIQHPDGRVTFYGHMRTGSVAVGVGDAVACGQQLGLIASSGYSTGPHVHFEPQSGGSFDPFSGGCSGGGSSWVGQGDYLGLPSMACEAVCTPHCEGSVIVDSGCGHGDCAAYGSSCADDALGARCVFFACPAVGEVDACIDDSHITHCVNGAATPPGDCGAYGAYCSSAGAAAARCVSVFCVASPHDAPTEHPTCLPDGRLLQCHADATAVAADCPGGQSCTVDASGAHCAAPTPPDAGIAAPDPMTDGGSALPAPDAGVEAHDGGHDHDGGPRHSAIVSSCDVGHGGGAPTWLAVLVGAGIVIRVRRPPHRPR